MKTFQVCWQKIVRFRDRPDLNPTLSEFFTANIPKIGQSMAPMYDDVEYVDMRFKAK